MNQNFQLRILTKDLAHALGFAGSIIEKKPARLVLGNIKLEAKEQSLHITGTSGDISMSINIPAHVESEGATTVNITTLIEIVRKIPDTSFLLSHNEEQNQLEIKCENFASHLSTISAAEFPSIENNMVPEGVFEVEAKLLLRLITNSEYAMTTEDTRYNLNGIYLNCMESNILNSAALDGHRLSTISEKLDNIPFFGFIIHRRTVGELLRILKDSQYNELKAHVKFDSNRIIVSIGNMEISSKLVDATFPDFASLIPEKSDSKLTIYSKILMDSVDRVSAITQDKYRAIKLSIKQDQIEISAFGEAKGTASEVIKNSADSQKFMYEGQDIEIGFNPKYLVDILKNCDDSEIELLFNSKEDPILIRPVLFELDKYIIMPMKV